METVTIGSEDYQAFVGLDEANTFLGGDVLRAAAWALRNDEAKGRGLVSATRMMLALPWCDEPPVDAPPVLVREVTAMLAADLLARPKLLRDASGTSNVKIAKAGSAQVEFFAPIDGGPPLPPEFWNRLRAADLICAGPDDDGSMSGAYVSGISDGCRPLEGRYADYCWPGYAAEDRD